MKTLLLAIFVLSPAAVFACSNKVDPKKVMLFVDTNVSDLEIATAEKAACARGEVLKVVPKNYKQYTGYIRNLESTQKKASKCWNSKTPECEKLQQDLQNAVSALQAFTASQSSLAIGVEQAMAEIKKSGGKLQNFTISGHDGGGQFGGYKGGISRNDLLEIMKGYEEINEAKSLLLLGCYTGTQNEVMEWKNIFPKTKMIGGYDGSAPLSDRPQGHQYLTDLLLKEKQLSSQADHKKLQAFVNSNFQGLNNLNAAMYIQCSDGSSIQEYYYGSKKSRQFAPLEMKECLDKKQQLTELTEKLDKYMDGELVVPKDTQNGELRQMYNLARTYEHCSEITGVNVNVNALFNMLFYEGVKESFGNYYKQDLLEAEKVINNLSMDEVEKNVREYLGKIRETHEQLEAEVNKFKNSPDQYFIDKEIEHKALKDKFERMMKDPKYARVKHIVSPDGMPMSAQSQIPPDELENYSKLYGASFEVNLKKSQLEYEKVFRQEALKQKEMMLSSSRQNIDMVVSSLASFKDPSKRIWVPTAENLKKYSRKELMDNLHRMNSILANMGPAKGRKELTWVTMVSSNNLQSFENPFSWHEYTGRSVENPQRPVRLKDVSDVYFNQPFGGFGGMMGPSPSPFGFPGSFGGSGMGLQFTPGGISL